MKTVGQIKPNFGPVYAAAMYPELATIFQRHGYALAVHGSLARDFDLIGVPWSEAASKPEAVLKEVMKTFAVTFVGEPEQRHLRSVYTLSCGWGECAIDLSFITIQKPATVAGTQWFRAPEAAPVAGTQRCPVCAGVGFGCNSLDVCPACNGIGEVPGKEAR